MTEVLLKHSWMTAGLLNDYVGIWNTMKLYWLIGIFLDKKSKRVRVTLKSSSEQRVRFCSLERSSPLLDIGHGTSIYLIVYNFTVIESKTWNIVHW